MKILEQTSNLISFRVSDVPLATQPLATAKPHLHLERRLGRPVEACSGYTDNLVEDVSVNPLLASAKLAFDQHRPLSLSPDMIWLTLLQGVAEHLYSKKVSGPASEEHQVMCRHPVVVSTAELPVGSPESDWSSIIFDAADQAKELVTADIAELFSVSFSTTTPVAKATFDLTLLAGLNRYLTVFDALAICGFPCITLEGTVDDWRRIDDSLELLDLLDLPVWTKKLRQITAKFVSASQGNPDISFWEQMVYKRRGGICKKSDIISGWISNLFPYGARFGSIAQPRRLNGQDQTDIVDFPSGLGCVPMASERDSQVDIHAGLIGVAQHDDLTLRAKLGWAIQRRSSISRLIDEVSQNPSCNFRVAHHGRKPKMLSRPVTIQDLLGGEILDTVRCRQLQEFYDTFEDCEILSSSGSPLFRLRSSEKISWKENEERRCTMARIADLPDGRMIGLCEVRDSRTSNTHPAFFLCDEDDAFDWRPCLLISGDFSQVIRWAIEAGDGLMDTAASFKPLALIKPTEEEIIRVLGSSDAYD